MNYEEEFKKLNIRRNELKQMQLKELQEKYANEMMELIGRFFKVENYYDAEEKWFEYYEVIKVDIESINQVDDRVWWSCIVKKFTQLPDGDIIINMKEHVGSGSLGVEIKYDEFIQAQKDILNSITQTTT